jgi:hypothetical protein
MPKPIEVTFVDASTGQAFAQASVPASELPETFELATTLHIGELEWRVESAEPETRAEYERTNKLELRLRKVERIDPKTILFSLSTIENSSPASNGDPITGDALELHEDDWRQLELISLAHEDAIDEELDAIGEIHLNHRAGPGFRKIHVRKRIPEPLVPNALPVSELGALSARSLRLRGSERRIPDSFVRELGASAALYGIADRGDVRVLGLRVEGALEDDALKLLERLQREHSLLFVDWCSCRTGMAAFFDS